MGSIGAWLSMSFVLGAAWGAHLNAATWAADHAVVYAALFATLGLGLAGMALRRGGRRDGHGSTPHGTARVIAAKISFGLACACLGVAVAAQARDEALDASLRAVLERRAPGFAIDTLGPPAPLPPITTRVALLEDAACELETTTLRAQVRALKLDGAWHAVDGGLIVNVGGDIRLRSGHEWRAGRTLEMPVTFHRPARYLNAGVPDFERDLALDGTTLAGSVKSGLLVDVTRRGTTVQEWAAETRRSVRRAVTARIGERDPLAAAIVTAVLIGDRTGLPDEVRQRLQAAGTYHVIAISGGNIAILAALCIGLLHLTGLAGRPAAAMTILLLIAYAQVVTAGASVWRATVMASLVFAARLLDHRTPPWHALAVTAAAVVWLHPLDVRDVAFLLTFGATAALLGVAGGTVDRRIPHVRCENTRSGSCRWTAPPVLGPVGPAARVGRPVQRHPRAVISQRTLTLFGRACYWMWMSVAASLAIEVALLPVSAYVFSRVTVAGLLLNLLAVPAMGAAQVAGLVVAGGDRWDVLAEPAAAVAAFAARLLVDSARLVELVPWLSRRVPPPGVFTITAYYLALALVVMAGRRMRIAGACALAALIAIIGGVVPAPGWPSSSPPVLRLTMFDVGQGDSLLLQGPDGRALLIDAGGAPFGGQEFDIGGRVLAPALWAMGVRTLDALLVTHGHPDHIGGARTAIADFRTAELWEGIPVLRDRPLQALLTEARTRGVRTARRVAGETVALGAVQLRVLHPSREEWERQRVRNDDSVVVEARYGDVAILLAGDIGADVEREILPRLTPARVRVLKVGHHGSRTSSSSALLEAWRPQIALVSAGRGNTFGHPAPETLARLAAIGATVYRTDRDGQITLVSDGAGVSISTFVPRVGGGDR